MKDVHYCLKEENDGMLGLGRPGGGPAFPAYQQQQQTADTQASVAPSAELTQAAAAPSSPPKIHFIYADESLSMVRRQPPLPNQYFYIFASLSIYINISQPVGYLLMRSLFTHYFFFFLSFFFLRGQEERRAMGEQYLYDEEKIKAQLSKLDRSIESRLASIKGAIQST